MDPVDIDQQVHAAAMAEYARTGFVTAAWIASTRAALEAKSAPTYRRAEAPSRRTDAPKNPVDEAFATLHKVANDKNDPHHDEAVALLLAFYDDEDDEDDDDTNKDNIEPQRESARAATSTRTATKATMSKNLTTHEQMILDRHFGAPGATRATCDGAHFTLHYMSPEAAAARARDLRAQGVAPRAAPGDVSTRTFQSSGR